MFCVLLSLLTGVMFGIGPAWMNTRRDPHTALKAGGRTIAGSIARRRLGSILMALQLALAMVLLSGAGLMFRSFLAVQKVDLGYQPQRLFLLHLDVPAEQNAEAAQFYQGALARIRAISGVQDAGGFQDRWRSLSAAGLV
jgi:putative ABC transport system permease protein